MRSFRAAIRPSLPSEGQPYEDGPLHDLISGPNAWALARAAATDPNDLVRAADERLMARKRERRPARRSGRLGLRVGRRNGGYAQPQ